MNFYVMSATIDGEDLQAGDEVAVFDEGLCVGVGVISNPGSLLSFVASKDDPVTAETIDGYREGNQVIVKVWDASAATEITDINISIVSGELIFNAGKSLWFNMALNAGCVPPPAPVVGAISHPDCTEPTGSVVLSGLPATGTWTLTKNPGGDNYSGSGTSFTVTGLETGNYTFTVTDAAGCTSAPSANVVINVQPSTPTAPVTGTVTHPTYEVPTGSVVLTGLPATGTWTLTENPGGKTYTGSAATYTVTELAPGNYTFTVTNAEGCTSSSSTEVVINPQTDIPDAPVVGTITHPTCNVATGTVVLNGLPSTGMWTLTKNPGGETYSASGTSYTVAGLPASTYTFTVTNAEGKTSVASVSIVINNQPPTPNPPAVGNITQPTNEVTTGSVVLTGLPVTGIWALIRNPGSITYSGTGISYTVEGLPAGTYTFTVISADGCTSDPSAEVIINPLSENSVPYATNVVILGTARAGQLLTGSYTYNDTDSDQEGSSSYRWLRNDSPIEGAVSLSYLLTDADIGKEIRFEVLPAAQTGASPGAPVQSAGLEVLPRQYSLTITVNNPDGGTTMPEPGIYYYDEGTTVTITGLPDDCFLFDNWLSDVACNDSIVTDVIIDEDISITINFMPDTAAPEFNEELPTDAVVDCDSIPPPDILTAADSKGDNAAVEFAEEKTNGSCENNFLLVRRWTAKDKCGNEKIHVQNIQVSDNIPPSITCPPDSNVNFINDIPDSITTVAAFIDNGGNIYDNCGLDEYSFVLDSASVYITGESYKVRREYSVADLCGNIASCYNEITVLFPSPAIKINSNGLKYMIVPNPNSGRFSFRTISAINENIDLKLMNSKGQLVEERIIESSKSEWEEFFDVSHLSKGIYYLIIRWDYHQQSEKIVIQ